MNTLLKLQQTFTDWVLRGRNQDPISALIKANGLTVEQCLQIYRNNTQLGLTEALRDGYPVVSKLVGKDFFNQLARSFIRCFPPKAGCLLSFGSEFADFIGGYQLAAGLPYLPDVARLEWYRHEAFHEADVCALDITSLVGVNPDCYGELGFTLHPTARLHTSEYPVLAIWQTNQEGYEGDVTVNLAEGGCQLLVYRPGLDIEIVALTEAEYQFLRLLDTGLTLTQAVEEVTLNDNAFNLLPVLQHWLAKGLFTDFST
jgi:Putative DNA-binding domain